MKVPTTANGITESFFFVPHSITPALTAENENHSNSDSYVKGKLGNWEKS